MNTLKAPRGQGRPLRQIIRRGFTLAELVVVVAVATLLLVVCTPAIRAARSRSDSAVCLSNLRTLGQCIRAYADLHDDRLPGPLSPSINHDATALSHQSLIERQFTWVMQQALGNTVSDRLVTCPTMSKIVPDWTYEDYSLRTGDNILPTHYGLNSYGEASALGTYRATTPPFYFGYKDILYDFDPVTIGAVANAEREWMIADAWYRYRLNSFEPQFGNEGPHQYAWGEMAQPYFAPHGQPAGRTYHYTTVNDRSAACSANRAARSDGYTNTLSFDGHAAGVVSRIGAVGAFEIFYGFPGTVNPADPVSGVVWQ
ncbi:MAG: prepilin-type N-terminal cleavage/methylation domain-containing protein [Phycisphaerae bacterium]|nr:prepilin-type N-terminal cleavage/methylation domain-containing protein [Phycisphaerae bacterium]